MRILSIVLCVVGFGTCMVGAMVGLSHADDCSNLETGYQVIAVGTSSIGLGIGVLMGLSFR